MRNTTLEPVTEQELEIHQSLVNLGAEEIEFRQRDDYGKNFAIIRISYWELPTDRQFNAVKEICPNATIEQDWKDCGEGHGFYRSSIHINRKEVFGGFNTI